jgi:endonuclease III
MVATADAKRHAAQIVRRLKAAYPTARCALEFSTPLELLVATILSAQCTDARVNLVTHKLFRKYRGAEAFATAKTPELERAIQSAGFFRMKAKSIKGACSKIAEDYGGKVPQDLDALVKLPGVGRKTANVVLGTAFGIPTGVVVDTHVTRVTRRLGMTTATDPVKIEQDLIGQIPKREWIDFSHRVIAHGRAVCVARKPKCEICRLNDICPKIGVSDRANDD